MSNLSIGVIGKRDNKEVFIDKIWKYNSRTPKFDMVGGSSFTATGLYIDGAGYEYSYNDVNMKTPGVTAVTLRKWANEAKKALKPGAGIKLIGKEGGRGSVKSIPITKFEKTAEFGGQGGGTSTGKLPANAATTRAQEKGSTYIFKLVLGTAKKSWTSVDDLKKDKVTMKKLNAIWQKEVKVNVNETWLSGYFKQHERMLKEFGGPAWTEFDHSGAGSFMDYITAKVNKKFGIAKKDNWDPADMWLIKGTTASIKKLIDETTDGSKATQTINELNALMRTMYNSNQLVGISLKAISGKEAKFSEYNVSPFTQGVVNAHTFPDIKLTIDLSKDMSQDSKAELRPKKGSGGFNFQIKSNSSTSWSNLKWESTPVGATAARGGKAQVDKVVDMLKEDGRSFDKTWSNYPRDATEFIQEQTKWETKFKYVKTKAKTNINSTADFTTNIEAMFKKGTPSAKVANSKLMQLAFLYDILKIKENKGVKTYVDWWTDLIFLSIKLGPQYGPFGKLY